jgi:hypothetical protein
MNAARLGLLLGLASGGCNSPEAIQIVLTPDPALTPLETLLARLDSVQVAVDAEGGLAGVHQAGARADGSTAVDLDGDGELEVLFSAPVGADELPILEIGLSENAGRELDFQVYGFESASSGDPAEAVALGGVRASCPPGEQVKVGAPFNLRSWARPPQVVLVLPSDGGHASELLSVTVLLSTTVDPDSAVEQSRVLDPDENEVPAVVTVEDAYVGQDEARSVLTIAFEEIPDEGLHRVQVGPGIVSTAGERFDQDLTTEAEDAFESSFSHNEAYWGSEPCECDETNTGCVPVLDCSDGCWEGFTCDPEQGYCVEDCRLYEACVEPGFRCDEATGLCTEG